MTASTAVLRHTNIPQGCPASSMEGFSQAHSSSAQPCCVQDTSRAQAVAGSSLRITHTGTNPSPWHFLPLTMKILQGRAPAEAALGQNVSIPCPAQLHSELPFRPSSTRVAGLVALQEPGDSSQGKLLQKSH